MVYLKHGELLEKTGIGIILGLLSALLFNLSFLSGLFSLVAWVVMVPVLLTLNSTKPKAAILIWFIYGFFFWLGAVYWLYAYMDVVLEWSLFLSGVIISILCFISCIPYSITGYLASRYEWIKSSWGGFKIAAVLTALIALVPAPFPGDLSMSQIRYPIVVQVAEIGGAHFLHFLIILVNVFIAQGTISFYEKRRIPGRCYIVVLLIIVFVLGYGYLRYNQFEKRIRIALAKDFINIGYVQLNLPGADFSKYYGDYIKNEEQFNNFITGIEQTLELVKNSPKLDLITWPETNEDMPYFQNESIRNAVHSIIDASAGAPFLFNGMFFLCEDKIKNYLKGYNSMYLVNNEKIVSRPYAKANLIPFSEYLPGEEKFPFLRKMFPTCCKMIPGESIDPILIGNKIKLIPLLCYDGIFPSFVRKYCDRGGNLFLSLDNDANFGPTKASELHFSVMYYRVIENRIPLVRVNNCGTSSVVLDSGRILRESETERFKKEYRCVSLLPGSENKTIYQMGGYLLPWFLVLIVILLSIYEKWDIKKMRK